jgi:hypothetical protein
MTTTPGISLKCGEGINKVYSTTDQLSLVYDIGMPLPNSRFEALSEEEKKEFLQFIARDALHLTPAGTQALEALEDRLDAIALNDTGVACGPCEGEGECTKTVSPRQPLTTRDRYVVGEIDVISYATEAGPTGNPVVRLTFNVTLSCMYWVFCDPCNCG